MENVSSTDLEAFRRMLIIRRFEEMLARLGDEFPGHRHVAIGQEAVPVAVALLRRQADPIVSNHRNHAHNLALGADPSRMFAEIYGRGQGYAQGKSGTFHISVPELGLMCTPAIVGAGLPIACGLAYSAKLAGKAQATVVYFGDGSLNEGAAHESLNLAGLWQLPIVFVCENNSGSTEGKDSDLAANDIQAYGSIYNMPATWVSGADYQAVSDAVEQAFKRAHHEGAPTLIEVRTPPWVGNQGGWPRPRPATPLFGVAPDADITAWLAEDPLARWAQTLVDRGLATREELLAWDATVSDEIQAAVQFARDAEPPSPDLAVSDVWA